VQLAYKMLGLVGMFLEYQEVVLRHCTSTRC